jgi:hypothetical protein
MKRNRNWLEIKQEFFDSNTDDLQGFLKAKLGLSTEQVKSGYYIKKTKGWKNDKREYRLKLAEKTQEKILNNPKVHDKIKNLIIALDNAYQKIAILLGDKNTQYTIEDLPKIKSGLEMLRLATGQSTTNIKSEEIIIKRVNK